MAEEKKNWIPEIMYEESSGEGSSNLPFIQVPQDEEMPKLLFMFESRQTEDVEPGPEGEELPVFEWDLHQYANMAVLKEAGGFISKLDGSEFELVGNIEKNGIFVSSSAKLHQEVRNFSNSRIV